MGADMPGLGLRRVA